MPRLYNSILHRGPSPFEPEIEIACIMTGITKPSGNIKTGEMPGIWTIRTDLDPFVAQQMDQMQPFCGDCPLHKDCYVQWWQAPKRVYTAFHKGVYAYLGSDEIADYVRGLAIRFGAGGEPVCLPLPKVEIMADAARVWTGYTRQWMKPEFQGYSPYFMASVFSVAERDMAWDLGWRTYRTADPEDPNTCSEERHCPASDEMGKLTTCIECLGCSGTTIHKGQGRVRGYVVFPHGNRKNYHIALGNQS